LYTTVGCYLDSSDRRLPVNYGTVKSTSECYMKAREGGQTLFGVQYGGECWAGTDAARAISLGTSTACHMACASGEACGSAYVSNVFSIGRWSLPAPWYPSVGGACLHHGDAYMRTCASSARTHAR
jgi:hypothetical protein